LNLDLVPEAVETIGLIISIARFEHDVRADSKAGKINLAIVETEEERHRLAIIESDDPNVGTPLS
jgi:hypothetical protein